MMLSAKLFSAPLRHCKTKGCSSQRQRDGQAHIIENHDGVLCLGLALISSRVWYLRKADSGSLLQLRLAIP